MVARIGTPNPTPTDLPVGTELDWPFSNRIPPGFVVARGQLLNRQEWSELWELANSTGEVVSDSNWSSQELYGCFSDGDGSTSFRVPDLNRGDFIRQHDEAGSRQLGSHELDQMQQITGALKRIGSNRVVFSSNSSGAFSVQSGNDAAVADGTGDVGLSGHVDFDSAGSPGARTGTETYPRNVTRRRIIKAKSTTGFLTNGTTVQVNAGGLDVSGSLTLNGNSVSAFSDGFLNKIINGNFDIWQRGTSQTSRGYGSDDRWFNSHTETGTVAKTHSRQTFSLGQTDVLGNPDHFSRTEITDAGSASDDNVVKYQPIEGVRTLSGQTVTFTFWAKADAAKNIAVEFVQNFGTGGTPSTQVEAINVTTFNLTTSWQKFTTSFDLPSISGKTLGDNGDDSLRPIFWFSAGSDFNSRTNSLGLQTGIFDISRVSLVEGNATLEPDPFEERHPQQELTLCQRYFTVAADQGSPAFAFSNSDIQAIGTFPTEMRTKPTVTLTSANLGFQNGIDGANTTSASFTGGDNTTKYGYRERITGFSGLTNGYPGWIYSTDNSYVLTFDAEL